MLKIVQSPVSPIASQIFLLAAVFVLLTSAILSRPPKWLSDFDQSFYLTIAYDIERYGVFSNGIFDKPTGRKWYPQRACSSRLAIRFLFLAVMGMDSRFSKAVGCSVEANIGKRNGSE